GVEAACQRLEYGGAGCEGGDGAGEALRQELDVEAAIQAGNAGFDAGSGQRGGFRGGVRDQVEGLILAGETEAAGGIVPGGCNPLAPTFAVDLQLLAEACQEGVGAGLTSTVGCSHVEPGAIETGGGGILMGQLQQQQRGQAGGQPQAGIDAATVGSGLPVQGENCVGGSEAVVDVQAVHARLQAQVVGPGADIFHRSEGDDSEIESAQSLLCFVWSFDIQFAPFNLCW
ncbi:MAG: hypothetical protein PVI97_16345, partial [Candidatus Thiodiazotropha sp.]